MNIKLKFFLHNVTKTMVRNLAKFFWLFPVNGRRIMCIPVNRGDFSCNPKYIALALEKIGKYDVIVALNSGKDENCPVKVIKYLSLKFFYYVTTSKVIVENDAIGCFPKRKNQYVINTWHGGGAYKRCGIKDISRTEKVHISTRRNTMDLILSSCESFSKNVVPDLCSNFHGEILPSGSPRNDLFYSDESKKVAKKVRLKFSINDEQIILLYAPTFRGKYKSFYSEASTNSGDINFDPEKVLHSIEKRFEKKPVIFYRSHVSMNYISKDIYGIDVTFYPDMQELLCAADILISDYSSTIWDFSLMKKPCFLYCPDLYYYLNDDRGTYTPVETWPGILCCSNDELEKAILNFDRAKYVKKIEKHHRDLGSYETGHACEQVCKRISEVCRIAEKL